MCAAGALRGEPASTTTTRRPARVRTRAADRPAAPPPMTATSYSLMTTSIVGRPGTDNECCCFWESGVHWSGDGRDRCGPGPGRATAAQGEGSARHHADRRRGADRHLQEHAVALGERPATTEPGAAAPAG